MTGSLADRVVATVEFQTSPMQPDSVRRSTVVRLLTHQRRDDEGDRWETVTGSEHVQEAIDEAVADGRVAVDETDEQDGGDRLRVA
jgi:hypothetical protein